MKLKSIASLCKNRKMVYIYSGSGCQYIGQGCACWLVPGTLEVSKGNVLTIFDIPEDKQADWMVQEESLLGLMADVLQGEEQAEIYPFDLDCYDSTYRLLKDADGIAVIDTQYLAPLAGIKQGLQYYIRRTGSGQEVVAVKTGFELLALITASNAEIIKDAFLDNLQDLRWECGRWADKWRETRMLEIIIIGLALFGGLILLPVLYEVALWLHRRRFARKLHQMAEAEKDAHHNRRAS